MLRLCIALLLVCASAHAMAQNGRTGAANADACQQTEAVARDDASQVGPNASRASAARSKYAKPANTAAPNGGSSSDSLPRQRGAKWHSFLPGMFR